MFLNTPVNNMAQNKVGVIIGATGSGKTPFITGGKFEPGLAKMFLDKGMSTLIIDEVDHVAYRQYPVLKPREYGKLSTHPGIYRTICPLQHMEGLMQDIAENHLVWNTLLVSEDAGKWMPLNIGQKEKTLIGNSKQQNVDLIFMFWAWGQVPPKLFGMTKYLVILKTGDSPECRKEYLTTCYQECLEAHQEVSDKNFVASVDNKPYRIVETGL